MEEYYLMWKNMRTLWFYTKNSFLEFMEEYFLSRSRNWMRTIQHEMEHSEKAEELGYSVRYGLVIGTSRDWGWDVILEAGVGPIEEFKLKDLMEICSAPRNPSVGDKKLIELCQSHINNGKSKGKYVFNEDKLELVVLS